MENKEIENALLFITTKVDPASNFELLLIMDYYSDIVIYIEELEKKLEEMKNG